MVGSLHWLRAATHFCEAHIGKWVKRIRIERIFTLGNPHDEIAISPEFPYERFVENILAFKIELPMDSQNAVCFLGFEITCVTQWSKKDI